jgi:hypothetical protein
MAEPPGASFGKTSNEEGGGRDARGDVKGVEMIA